MRLFLLTRLPRTAFVGIPLRQLKLLYMKHKAEKMNNYSHLNTRFTTFT